MIGALDQVIRLTIDETLSKEAQRLMVVNRAKEVLKEIQSRIKGPKIPYKIFSGNVEIANENAVQFNQSITYEFYYVNSIAKEALIMARDMSPIKSGRYRKSWFLMFDGAEVDVKNIPGNASEIILTNDQPYARKIQTRGARLIGVEPGIVDRLKVRLKMRFGKVADFQVKFIELHGAYKLRHDYVQKRKNGRRRLREHAGSELMYPALIIQPRIF